MKQVAIEQLSEQFYDLIQDSKRGEDVRFTQGDVPVARLVSISPTKAPRKAGSAKHLKHFMAADFNDIPDGFEERSARC